MKAKLTLAIVLLLILPGVAFPQYRELLERIKKIRVLDSSREDVLRLLGRPANDETSDIWSYHVDAGDIDISFTNDKCLPAANPPRSRVAWRVAAWTVEEVAFSPKNPIDLSKLKLDLKKLQAKPIHDSASGMEYFDDELGVYYIVNSKRKIEDIIFVPPKSRLSLRCE